MSLLNEIHKLQAAQPFQEFALELDNGRIVQIYRWGQLASYATHQAGHFYVGVLRGDGAFEVIDGSHIVSVSVGVHPVVKEQRAKQIERFKELTGES